MVADDTYAEEVQLLLARFGETVKRVRRERGISQEALADQCGLHRTQISLLERGRRSPRLPTLIVIARELGVPSAALLDHLPAPQAKRLTNADKRESGSRTNQRKASR